MVVKIINYLPFILGILNLITEGIHQIRHIILIILIKYTILHLKLIFIVILVLIPISPKSAPTTEAE